MSSIDCAMCNNPATLRCSACRCSPIYCSKPCQLADWKLHKNLCKSRPSFETPPTPESRRAIVFLESGEIKFTWETTCMKTDEDDGTIWESPTGLEKYFGGQRPKIQPYYNNVIRNRRLKEHIDLRFNDNFLLDGSPKNLAVCKVVEGMDNGGAVWRGALVALKQTNTWLNKERTLGNESPGFGHMDLGDFREVVDYLTNWKRNADTDPETRQRQSQKAFEAMMKGL
ncbi:hypothetical protein CPB83DRAFT_857729 [Crepidotus variabilis]|uniref:MYND-type domain-containing protein n=1 Tax=Crepidotus variabilis TaxID=179855 RepID=A0A9P6ECN8_9AGAR|nr:hypothetical protein CPB83DRAFT_857729 [Crepidotus variabilis]